MKTFLVAICILLVMLGGILVITRHILREVTDLSDALSSLPPPGESTCLAEASKLEAKWLALRPLASTAINGRTIAEIDRLMISLRVLAASYPDEITAWEWERSRAGLKSALRDLCALLRCGLWEIL